MAQSQMRPPVNELSGTAATTIQSHNHVYAAAMVRLFADLLLLTTAAFTGFLVDVFVFGDDPTMENRETAIWVPVLFVFTSLILLKVLGSRQHSSHGFSLKDWAQTGSIIALAVVIVWAITEVTLHMQPNGEVAAAVLGSAIVLLPIGRSVVGMALRSKGIGTRRVVVVGDMDIANPVLRRLDRSGSGHQIVGNISPVKIGYSPEDTKPGTVSLQALESLPGIVKTSKATDLLIAVSSSQYTKVREVIRESIPAGVTVHIALSPLLNSGSTRKAGVVSKETAVQYRGATMPWQYDTVKRVFDITAALLILVAASPVLAVIAIMVKMDSPGPVFFKQKRVGRRGQFFGMYKFRSMKVNAENMLEQLQAQNEAGGHMFKMKDDPRVTRLGKIIRKLSVDELPQLFNVLNGSMSLVGPRPPLPKEVEQYEDWHYERLDGIPGITGLWQVKRGPVLDFEEMVNYDLEYLNDWSLWKDVSIMLRTIPVIITGRGSY